jgi:hypothetical protein
MFIFRALGRNRIGAGNGSRTRDLQLGKLTLYQLSYSRSGAKYYSAGLGGVARNKQLAETDRAPQPESLIC